ncbi:S-layer homology domain-containing protein [Tepidanaerobacter acetatoxydans]|uniref:S-layer homology domain-containing protein n=1 Tax=Tepidanaerobacter acetatoxydans TaxID=499229 RepID=UPI00235B62FC|nr:S-layer homology domain-containing protein [Tepidanaerobacter acetatoxydans]
MLLSSILAVRLPATAEAQNLLVNGDFEEWESGLPIAWYGLKSNLSKSNVNQVTDGPKSGNYTVQLIETSSNHKRFTTKSISLKAGVEYILTYWVKGKGEIRNAFYRDGNYSSYTAYTEIETDEWKEITYVFSYDKDVDDVEIIFSLKNTSEEKGHIQIDDVILTSNEIPSKKVANVTAEPKSKTVPKGTKVKLQTSTEGATIYYTTNGAEPIVQDTVYGETVIYTEPIVINADTTINAVAVKEGMENSDISTFTYNIAKLVSIAEARKLNKGDFTIIKGIVTFIDSNYNYFIQDESAAIDIFKNREDLELQIGDEVQVFGKLDAYGGLLEIIPEEVTVISHDNQLPEPKLVTFADIKTDNYQCQRVKVEKVYLGKTDGYNTNIIDLSKDTLIIFRIPELTDVKEGDLVDIIGFSSIYNNTYQLRVWSAEDIIRTELGPDNEAPKIEHTPVTEGNINLDLEIKAKVTDNRQVKEVKLFYRTKGETEYKQKQMSLINEEYATVILKDELNKVGLEYYIWATDETNETTTPQNTDVPYFINIVDADILSPTIISVEPAEGAVIAETNTKPAIKAEYSDLSGIDTDSVKIFVDGIEVTNKANINLESVTYIPAEDLRLGNHTVAVYVSDTRGNESSKTWTFTIGELNYQFRFGQLHSHTNVSDGTGTPDEAYTWARDRGKADFFAVTDHSNWFDNELTNENITDISQSTSEKWKLLNQKADEYYKAGEYVALAGYEMTWSGATGGWGHINTFNTPWFASRSNDKMDLPAYYKKIAKWPESINQLNHPGKTFGDFADFGFYSEETDNVVQLIEVGNGEGPVRGSGYFPSYEYYTRALDKGWHLAPSNNQDNHKGNWITSNEARTVILSEELTKESIYDSIRDMRVYATENKNLEIMYKINGQLMGSRLSSPNKLNVSISINEPDINDQEQKIKKVELISNGGVVSGSKTFDSYNVDWNFQLDPMYDYYYVKVTQANKDISVTSPVWVGQVLPIGLAGLDVSSDYFELGDTIDLGATVYNNGSTILSKAKVEFYVDSISQGNKIGEDTVTNIGQGATTKALISWKPEKAGEYNLYAVATVDGIEKTFTASRRIEVVSKGSTVKVMVDFAHSNHYVSGDYSGKIETLKQILKGKKMLMVENHDIITDEILKDIDILIITSPQPRDKGEVKKAKLTDNEIQSIARFTDRGGSLILTSRANYGDGVGDYQNSIQANKVLNAIGSNIIFNSDQVVDYENNGGQQYRLYLETYTSEKYNLTSGLAKGDQYSFYSGCSVLLKEDGNAENVDFLVKGHSTTENENAGKTPAGFIEIEKGNVYVLAAEILPNGGKVIASGSTFFSDFEMAADNIYSNIQITNNLLDWLRPEGQVQVKTIKEVRDKMPKNFGQEFTIEGRVTAVSEAYSKQHNLNNAFFEVIYVQDETGGITVFGVSQAKLPLGMKVRITGIAGQYEGDYQLQIRNEAEDLIILDDPIKEVEPKLMSTADSMKKENEGWLVKVKGKVTRIDNGKNSLYVDDGTGEARVYVNGYIGDGSGDESKLGKWDPNIKTGDIISAIGLASTDPEGPRLRVRNTAEIVKEKPGKPGEPSEPKEPSRKGQSKTKQAVQEVLQGKVFTENDITILLVDEDKVAKDVKDTLKTKIQFDLTDIGATHEKALEIPADVFNLVVKYNKNIIIKSDEAVLQLDLTNLARPQEAIDFVNKTGSIKFIIHIKDKITTPLLEPITNPYDIAIRAGSKEIITEFPLKITFNIQGAKDIRKAGVYYLDETTNQWEYAGGKADKKTGTITFEAKHSSTYAVFVYNKDFKDVSKDDWAYDAINVLVARHIIKGKDEAAFLPNGKITRAEFAALVIRTLGIEEEPYKGKYGDVKERAWYANIMEAAYKAGIMLGDGRNMRPDDPITREEMTAAVVRAYEKLATYKEEKNGDVNTIFSDNNIISEWARDTVADAVKLDIVKGYKDNTFRPKNNATRAEAAAMLYRILEKTGNI